MKQGCGISLGNWIAIAAIVVATLGLVNNIVDRKVDEINVRFDRVEKTIDRVDTNVKEHVKYHLDNKGKVNCQPTEQSMEVSYAEVAVKGKEATREANTKGVKDKRVR
jgi:hypothetical protein